MVCEPTLVQFTEAEIVPTAEPAVAVSVRSCASPTSFVAPKNVTVHVPPGGMLGDFSPSGP